MTVTETDFMWPLHTNSSNGKMPFAGTPGACISEVVGNGYTECFKVTTRGLYAISRSRYYRPEQVQIISFYRFENPANSADDTTIYVLETSDGLKGTLVDASGVQPDAGICKFITEAEDIRSKMSRYNNNQNFC